jgi:hypothetical protein
VGDQFRNRPPAGHELDQALVAAGLEPLPVPAFPRVVVFWQVPPAGGSPAPAAVLIDAPEPLFRQRPVPTEVSSDGMKRYRLDPQPWLDVVPDPATAALVDVVVPAPGGQRALVTLHAGARGQRLVVNLRRTTYPGLLFDPANPVHELVPFVDITFLAAPWEE